MDLLAKWEHGSMKLVFASFATALIVIPAKAGIYINSRLFSKLDSRVKPENDNNWQAGFTLIEMLVVIGIIGTLVGLSTISLVKVQHNTTVTAAVDQLLSDMRTQQTKAMAGTEDTNGNANSYGVYIDSTNNKYVLFQGTTYSAGASNNFSVSLTGITFSPTETIDFSQRSGEIGNSYTITVINTNGSEQKTITMNKYGVVTSVQ